MRKVISLLSLTVIIWCVIFFSFNACSNEQIDKTANVVTVNSDLQERNINRRHIVFEPTVSGTIEEQIASMVITDQPNNGNTLVWTVNPNQYYHVVIVDSDGYWLMQTSTTGAYGWYLGGYLVNRDRNDGNIYIVKGETYYLYFRTLGIYVPFVL